MEVMMFLEIEVFVKWEYFWENEDILESKAIFGQKP